MTKTGAMTLVITCMSCQSFHRKMEKGEAEDLKFR